MWPQALPERWLVGAVVGVAVDSQDHVWIVHRPGTLQPNETRSVWDAAPPVLEFDPAGRVVSSWGGQGSGYEWPDLEHAIHVDDENNVWVAGGGPKDAQILKFTRLRPHQRSHSSVSERRELRQRSVALHGEASALNPVFSTP